MALGLQIALAALEFHDLDLVLAIVLEDLRRDRRPWHVGLADGDVLAVDHQEHTVELDGLAGVPRQLLHAQAIALGDPVLLAAGFDDCVHVGLPVRAPRPRLPAARVA